MIDYDERRRRQNVLARKHGGVVDNHSQLLPGDRFILFVNEAEDVDLKVFVHDKLDGFGYCHEEVSGAKHVMTGEWDVLRLRAK